MRFSALLPLLWGAFLLVALVGCKDFEIIECTPEEELFIADAQAWVIENADRIEANINAHWDMSSEASMEEIIGALISAEPKCGLRKEWAEDAAASHVDPGNWIVYYVTDDYFKTYFNQYQEYGWTQDTLIEFEGSTSSDDLHEYQTALNNSLPFVSALAGLGGTQVHEALHEVLHRDHTDEVKELHDRIRERAGGNADSRSFKNVDVFYAATWWTFDTAQILWEEAMDEFFATYPIE